MTTRSIKNRFHENNIAARVMSIGEYIERNNERLYAPGRIINGVMEVQIHGHWISKDDFDKYYPPLSIDNMQACKTNPDTTKKWMQ